MEKGKGFAWRNRGGDHVACFGASKRPVRGTEDGHNNGDKIWKEENGRAVAWGSV